MAGSPHVVVTGGAGFLGSHLVDSLLADGYRVTSIDNYGSGSPKNLAHIESARLEKRDHDVSESFPDFDSVEHLYHLASRASPDDFASHAIEIALTNSQGTHNAIECALEHDATLLLASTSEVYGNPEVHPQHESYNGNVDIRGLRAPYDESKRFGEALAVAYDRQFDVDIRTLRIFNTYGPRMRLDDGRVVPNFLTQALRGKDLTVYGSGSQTRSFCYVDDLIASIRAVVAAGPDIARGTVFNAGHTDEITIMELAETVLDLVDTDSRITHKPLPEGDPEVRQPDVSKLHQATGWEPTTSLRDGLQRTIQYYLEQM